MHQNSVHRILLIHPLGENWVAGESDMSRIANIMPPIGLCSLAAWVEHHGHQARIYDCYASPGRFDVLVAHIDDFQPDYVGFSTTTSSFLDAIRMAKLIRQISPQTKVIFGGVHVSALRDQLLRDYAVIDIGVVGEGEQALSLILDRDGTDLKDIPGVIFRKNDEVVSVPPVHSTLDLDTLPFPAYDKLDGFPQRYALPIFNYPRSPGATVVTSRGCPYTCSYCDRSVFQQTFRFNSAEYMVELMDYLSKRFGVRHINFYDDQFTLNRKRVEEFCELKRRRNIRVTFNCAARAEHVDPDILLEMKRAGCWMVSLGIETGDPALLARHRSFNDLESIRRCVHWIKEAGIRAKGLFMLGLPGETEDSIERSIQYALSLPLDQINVAKFTPFPGSPAYSGICENGSFNEDWELMNCLNFVFVPTGLSKDRLETRFQEFYRRYFERPSVLLSYIPMLWQSPDSWRRLLRDLGCFLAVRRAYRRNSAETLPPSTP